MEQMTIHRALSELKLIDARIAKKTNEFLPVGVHVKDKPVLGYLPIEDFSKAAKEAFQSVTDLIQRKHKIKSAIVKANAITMVEIGKGEKKKMTIAEAINMKAQVVFKKLLAARLRDVHRAALAEVNKRNTTVDSNLKAILEAALGKEKAIADANAVKDLSDPYLLANQWHLFDPIDAIAAAQKIEDEVADFEAEVDATLSEINAVTIITVE